MNEKIKCAVIGVGWWGTAAHLPALKRHPDAEIVAVHSRHRDKAEKVAKDFGVLHACTTLDEVFAVPGLRGVIVATTPNAHYEQAKAALERGLHVLIEKPMTLKAAEAEELQKLADKKKVEFLVSCPWHYTAHGIEARRLVRSGKLGQVKMIAVMMTNFTLGLYQGKSWDEIFGANPNGQSAVTPYIAPGINSYSDPSIAGGGQIYCQISHVAAYLGFLTGREPAEVFARFDNAGTAVDVYDALNLKLDDGTLVSVASNGATMFSERNYEVRIYGTEGMILLELWKGTMAWHDQSGQVTRYPDLAESDIYPMFSPAENFVDVISGKAPNGSPGSTGVFAMRVIEASIASVRDGRNIVVASRS